MILLLPLGPVRQKAKEIISFIQDDERLKEARRQAKQARDKYVGYSSEETQSKYSEYTHLPLVLQISLVLFVLCLGDRYDPEPRSRSTGSSSAGTKYDPDPHGPLDRCVLLLLLHILTSLACLPPTHQQPPRDGW